MARVSRKYHKPIIEAEMKTALYARISVTESATHISKECNPSIENQIALMMNYIKDRPEFKMVKAYVDTNVSGATFNRPAFDEMMQDVRNGVVNCIIVKDISRFGRDYIEVGNYLENIFPFLNVRFISVTEQMDTFIDGVTLAVQIKNILGDSQCKYISEATRSSLIAKAKHGKLLLPNAPYGYLREDDGTFKVDENTAAVVQQIFALAAQGNSYTKIAKQLNDSGVPTRSGKGTLWVQSTIGQILKNRAYLGEACCTIGKEQFKQENAHTAILTEEEFEAAQHKGKSRKQASQYKSSPLVGKVVCGECGRSMVRSVYHSGEKEVASFQCRTGTVVSEASCFGVVLEADIEKAVRQKVLEHTEEMRKKLTELKDLLIEKSILLKRQEVEIQREIEDMEEHRMQVLGAMCNGEISREEFDRCCKDSTEAIKMCKGQMMAARNEYRGLYEGHVEVNKEVKKLRAYLRMENFLDRILRENGITIKVCKAGDIQIEFQ